MSTVSRALARRILLTGRPAYVRAFAKCVQRQALTRAEQRALDAVKAPDGGYPVPAAFDPTLSNGGHA